MRELISHKESLKKLADMYKLKWISGQPSYISHFLSLFMIMNSRHKEISNQT